jgi:subtilase family serine protease
VGLDLHDDLVTRLDRPILRDKGDESVALRRRHFVGLLALVSAALVAVAGASAQSVPPVGVVPALTISEAAASAAHSAPVCGPQALSCYYPSFLKQAYDFPTGKDAPTGVGQTIVVVTAYGSPTIADDLARFDQENGLPAPPSFTVIKQQPPALGDPQPDAVFGWLLETSLDVEYAHAMAPGANIVLAVAATDNAKDFAEVMGEVLPTYPGSIVTQSFGADESQVFTGDPVTANALEQIYANHVSHHGTVLASAGDFGAGPSFPASSPFVVSVGGTQGGEYPGGLWKNGHYGSEEVWNEPLYGRATGGGPSAVFPAPSWQLGLTGTTQRATPDVALNSALNGGVVVNFTFGIVPAHTLMGGTSAATPQWAGILALANELRGRQGRLPLGQATPQLYAIGRSNGDYQPDFHDITVGNNALGGDPSQALGFSATRGYDLTTGLGTPDVAKLVKDLAATDIGSVHTDDRVASVGGTRKHVRLNPGG